MIVWCTHHPRVAGMDLVCGFCLAVIRADDEYGAIEVSGDERRPIRTLIRCAGCTLRMEEEKRDARNARLAADAALVAVRSEVGEDG